MKVLLLLCAAVPVSAEWRQVSKAAPWKPRSDPQLALLGDALLLFGGHATDKANTDDEYFNDVWSSSDGGASWVELPAAPWARRSYHTAKVYKDELYMLGGHDNQTWYNDVWKTADGKAWQLVAPNAAWSARAATALQVRGDDMFVMGGSDGLLPPIGKGKCLNDVWRSSDAGATWQLLTAAAPWTAREGLQKLTALYGDNDDIVLTAGEAGYTGPYFNDVWTTADGANWTQASAKAGFSARSGNLLLNSGGALFTFGGYGFPMKHDAWCLPTGGAGAGGKWTELAKAPWKGRFDYDMALVNGSIVLLGGEASLFGTGGPYFNDVWVLDSPECA